MHQPDRKKPAAAGRATLARATPSAVGISAAQVREQLHRPTPAQAAEQQARARAQAAQQRRYQQITRSDKARAQLVAPQDGPLAHYAQAQQRAELRYRAQTTQRLHIEQKAAAQLADRQHYLHQGSTREEHARGRALALQQQLARNTRQMMQDQPEAAGIGSGVGVGMVVASQIVAPELALTRLAGTLRWMGAARAATVVGRLGTGLSYQAGPLNLKSALNAGKVFAGRAGQDVVLQYAGASIVNASEQYGQTGSVDAGVVIAKSVSGVNVMSALMAGLPGDDFRHSVRNALFANAYELNYDPEKGFVSKHVQPTWASGLNYGQKVGLSIGGDYLAGRFGGAMHKARVRDGYRSVGPLTDPHAYALWRQRMWLLHRAEFIGVNGTKITGGVAGSVLESVILPAPANE